MNMENMLMKMELKKKKILMKMLMKMELGKAKL